MFRTVLVLSALSIASSASTLFAEDDAAYLLKRVSETYKSLKSYHFESEYEDVSSYAGHGSWTKGRTTLVVAGPNRVHFEIIEPPQGAFTLVSDGKTVWLAMEHMREFSRVSLSGPLLDFKGGGWGAEFALARLKSAIDRCWRLDEDVKSAQVIRDETVDLQGSPVLCTVVHAELSHPRMPEVHSSTVTYWIDKERNLLVQSDWVMKGTFSPQLPYEECERRTKTRFTRIAIAPRLPESLFVYTPPDDFREVDRLEHPVRRTAAKDMIGKPAPELTAKTLDGPELTLSSLRGKPVLLDFWATWCAPCRDQMPAVAKLYRETKDQDLVLLGVNDDETPGKAIEYMKEKQYDWANLIDGKIGVAREKFKVQGIPTLVLIDKNGQIVEYQVGSGAETEKAIKAALRTLGFKID